MWNYSDGVSENFLERARLCVAEAGRVLTDFPKDADAEDFWLHRLWLDLRETNSEQLFAASEEGGMIVSLCVASATFCARLERKALEADGAEERRNASIDRAIASRKRMENSISGEARDTNHQALDAQKSRSLLGIDLVDLENLRREIWMRFFDQASLPRVVEDEWKAILFNRKMPDSHADLGVASALTREYQKAIARASAQLAELLATATELRIDQAPLREAIWRECLDFASQLGQWDAFAIWVGRVVHVGWQVVGADGTPSLTPDRECEKRLEERRQFFEGRIGMYWQEWLSAIDRAIETRRTVSAAHNVNTSGETGKQAKAAESKSARIDPEVAKRAALVKANPGIPADEMCETFDRENVPLPTRWHAAGLQSWSRAYKNSDYRSRIYTLISKDRVR